MSALQKTLVVVTFSAGVALWVSFIWLFLWFHNGHLPTAPQPDSGRLYASNNHGSVVYLTAAEDRTLTALQFGGLGLVVVGIVLDRRFRRASNNRWRGP
jgi:hypothetical protein